MGCIAEPEWEAHRLRTSLTVVGGVAAFLVVAWSALTFGGRRTKDAIRVVNKWPPATRSCSGLRRAAPLVCRGAAAHGTEVRPPLRHTGRGRPRRRVPSSRCPTGKAWTGSRTSEPRTGPG